MIIYRANQLIPVRIESATFYIRPMTVEQKQLLFEAEQSKHGNKSIHGIRMAKMVLKMALKDVKGIKYPDGENFCLKMDESGVSDESLGEIETATVFPQLMLVAGNWSTNQDIGLIDGVEVLRPETKSKKKKAPRTRTK